MAETLEVGLEFLTGLSDVELDKSLIDLINSLQLLKEEDRKDILNTLNAPSEMPKLVLLTLLYKTTKATQLRVAFLFLYALFAYRCGHEVGDIRAATRTFKNVYFLRKTLRSGGVYLYCGAKSETFAQPARQIYLFIRTLCGAGEVIRLNKIVHSFLRNNTHIYIFKHKVFI